MKKLKSYFDARDVFCATGFLFLYAGLALRFGHDVGLIVVGAIVLLKGLTRWV